MHGGQGRGQAALSLYDHAQQEEPAHAESSREEKYNPFLRRHTLHREIK